MITKVSSLIQLMQALATNTPQVIEIQSSILVPYPITLPAGYTLRGTGKSGSLISFNQGDGIGLTADNSIEDLRIFASPSCRAVFLLTGLSDMGTITLRNLKVTGQVSLITREGTSRLKLFANDIDVISCDARGYSELPQKYGVTVYQGAFTLYNFNGNPDSEINALLINISAGRADAPVTGSGILIAGFSDNGGMVNVEKLTTGPVYANGMLPYGTADIITGGIFINYGVFANEIINEGEVVTYGANDMVLDNWGTVNRWTANEQLISYGPSGIGFVNFGTVTEFVAGKEIITYGLGARGFNQYDGTIASIKVKGIATHGDGAIGIQISKPIGTIEIEKALITYGAVGNSLVKGVLTMLPAIAFSIMPGGFVKRLTVGGDISSSGDHADTVHIDSGTLQAIDIGGKIAASGQMANAIVIKNGGTSALTNVRAGSKHGKALVNENGLISDRTGFEEQVI
ncbi:hypothetical protein [Mucilaginibacter gilvus]|uniref:Uncharacterized protein n=1 Tax=Mucilaginibacter gilvus TaxID=2305909 RepID=A0A3S3W3B3_9SPHI|nr:hypothetical protein [Mucilaginibacter gilvus]RWY47366.1 hypothetical protein EPL05_21970 [Mucilaginibacter gilvus]